MKPYARVDASTVRMHLGELTQPLENDEKLEEAAGPLFDCVIRTETSCLVRLVVEIQSKIATTAAIGSNRTCTPPELTCTDGSATQTVHAQPYAQQEHRQVAAQQEHRQVAAAVAVPELQAAKPIPPNKSRNSSKAVNS